MADLPNIPSLSTKVDPETRKAFDSIKSWFGKVGRLASFTDLVGSGNFTQNGADLLPYSDTTVPPQITGFTVTGAFNSILLQWDDPRYANLSMVQVWRAEVDNLGVAVKVGDTIAYLYTDTPPDTATSVTYYYWVRIISKAGIVGPYNAVAGTAGHTADDPDYLLEILTDQLTDSQLHAALAARIDLIDTPTTGIMARLGGTEASISDLTETVNTLVMPLFDTATAYAVDDSVRYESNVYRCIQATTPPSPIPTDADYWLLVGVYSSDLAALVAENSATMIDMGEALALRSSETVAQAGEAVLAGLVAQETSRLASAASVMREESARADAISAEAAARVLLAAAVSANAAAIVAEQSTRANADTAEAAARTLLAAAVTSNTAAISNEATARANAVSAVASTVSTLQTTVGENTAAVQVVAESVDGLEGKYTVKVDVNGHVSGFGLAVDANTAQPTSEFAIRADRFSIAPIATDPAASDASPFYYLTVPTVVNGVTVPAGAYVKAAFIADATIARAMIQSLAVDSARIADAAIVEAKIGALAVTTAKIQNAAITYAKIGDAEVNTLKIAGNAVTVPAASYKYNSGLEYVTAATGVLQQLGTTITVVQVAGDTYSVMITATAEVQCATANAQGMVLMQLQRVTSAVTTTFAPTLVAADKGAGRGTPTLVYLDNPGVGTHVYKIGFAFASPGANDGLSYVSGSSICLVGAKR